MNFKNWKTIAKNNRHIIYITVLFMLMDVVIRVVGYKINIISLYHPATYIFSLLWIGLMIALLYAVKGIWSKVIYWVCFGLFYILFLTHLIYYDFTQLYFSFRLLKMSGEGSAYILDTILKTPAYVWVVAVIVLVLAVLISRTIPKQKKNHFVILIPAVLIFLVIHTLNPMLLGKPEKTLTHSTFYNRHSVYNEFNDSNKALKISGLYEYSFRDFYVTFLRNNHKISTEEKEFLDKMYTKEASQDTTNKYTGILKGKNVIFLQLEGLDSWILTKENTPNLYALKSQSLDFTDHYSVYTGGGPRLIQNFL